MGTSTLLYNEPPLLVQPSLAVAIGLNEAIALQQLHFWLGNKNVGIERNGYKWIHNTYEEWKENFPFWSVRTIQRVFSELEKKGVVVSAQFATAVWDHTKSYRIDYDKLEWIKNNPGGGTIDDDKLASSDNDKLALSSGDIDYTETTEESISFRNSTELERLSSVAQPESVSPIPSKSGLDVIERDQHRALHNVAQAEPVIAQDFATLIAESLPDTPEPVKAKSSKKAASAKSAPPPKPKREPKPPRELDQREAEFLAQVTKLDPFMGKQVESRLRKYRRDKPWSAIQVYLLTGKAVPPASLQAVTSLNGTAFDTELMLKCLSAWVSKGWSPTNLAWLLEWYKAGGPPQYTPKYAAPDAYVPPPKPQALEWEDSPIGKEAMARWAKQKAEKEQEMKGQV